MSNDANSRRGDADFDRSADLALTTTLDEDSSNEISPDDQYSRGVEPTTPARLTFTSGVTVEAAR